VESLKRELMEDESLLYSEEELDRMLDSMELQHFQIGKPDKEDMEKCIEALQYYMPQKVTLEARVQSIIQEVKVEASYFGSLELKVLLIMLFVFTVLLVISPNKLDTVFYNIAAVPMLLALISLNMSKHKNMIELELSLKRSWKNRMFARLLIGYGLSVIILMLLFISSTMLYSNTDILRYFSVSFFSIGALSLISLAILLGLRGIWGTIAIIILWLAFSEVLIWSCSFQKLLYSVSEVNYLIAAVLCTGLFIYWVTGINKGKLKISNQFGMK
jgi:hypothetical protein